MEEYLIHDNGTRPYKVKIYEDGHVDVYKEGETDPKHTFETSKVFVGKDPNGDKRLDGNTILIKKKNSLWYVWIGNRGIQSFVPKSDITTYISRVGNSNVPYPHCFDTNDNCYLLLANVMLGSIHKPRLTSDPYTYYYNLANSSYYTCPDITYKAYKLYLLSENGEIESPLTFDTEPEKRYTRFVDSWDPDIKFENPVLGITKQPLSRDTYVKILTEHAKKHLIEHVSFTEIEKRAW